MLEITVPAGEFWNSDTEEFVYTNETRLKLEHSLISISKWEAKYKRAYLTTNKSSEEMRDYIRFMCLTPNVPPEVFLALTSENLMAINAYLDDSHTATYIYRPKTKETGIGRGESVTSELVYYWMISYHIPTSFDKWNFNRLMSLIDVFQAKNNPKKYKVGEIARDNARLNAERRAALGSKG